MSPENQIFDDVHVPNFISRCTRMERKPKSVSRQRIRKNISRRHFYVENGRKSSCGRRTKRWLEICSCTTFDSFLSHQIHESFFVSKHVPTTFTRQRHHFTELENRCRFWFVRGVFAENRILNAKPTTPSEQSRFFGKFSSMTVTAFRKCVKKRIALKRRGRIFKR